MTIPHNQPCQARAKGCQGLALEKHHKLKRRFRDESPENFLYVCSRCHNFIETHPKEAYERGWSIRGNALPRLKDR